MIGSCVLVHGRIRGMWKRSSANDDDDTLALCVAELPGRFVSAVLCVSDAFSVEFPGHSFGPAVRAAIERECQALAGFYGLSKSSVRWIRWKRPADNKFWTAQNDDESE